MSDRESETNWAGFVPLDIGSNLRFRSALLERCARDNEFRDSVKGICRESVEFFINVFCWGFDPRKVGLTDLDVSPFVLWPYQVELMKALESALRNKEDLRIEKSRDMGASWCVLLWMLWRWMFQTRQSFLLVSRVEALVDGDTDSLFSHLDFVMERLPPWLLPEGFGETRKERQARGNRLKLFMRNPANDSVFEGEATTLNVGRGGRRTVTMIDEFGRFIGGGWDVLSATRANTNTRIVNSTPNGPANAFYALKERGMPNIRLHWSIHPERMRGLYRPLGKGTSVEISDREWHAGHPGYPFQGEIPNGEEGVRSPWYDRECVRAANPQEIASELDIDYQGSSNPFFPPDLLSNLREEFCRLPAHQGVMSNIGTDQEPKWVFQEHHGGPMSFWIELVPYRHGEYLVMPNLRQEHVVASDISQGTGASNSVSSAANRFSGEKIAELVSNRMSVEEFASLSVGLALFLSNSGQGAYMIWEASGPGETFSRHVVDRLGYTNIYYYRNETRQTSRTSDRPGFYQSGQNKLSLFTDYKEALYSRRFINPSSEALREASMYVMDPSGVTYKGLDTWGKDGYNHGDRVVADALCAKGCFRVDFAGAAIIGTESVAPGSLLELRQSAQRKLEFAVDEW